MKIPLNTDPGLKAYILALVDRIDRLENHRAAANKRLGDLEVTRLNPPVPVLRGYYYDAGINYTLDTTTMGYIHYVNTTAAVTVTLPYLNKGDFIEFVNMGTFALTVNDSTGATIATIAAGKHQVVGGGPANAMAAISI